MIYECTTCKFTYVSEKLAIQHITNNKSCEAFIVKNDKDDKRPNLESTQHETKTKKRLTASQKDEFFMQTISKIDNTMNKVLATLKANGAGNGSEQGSSQSRHVRRRSNSRPKSNQRSRSRSRQGPSQSRRDRKSQDRSRSRSRQRSCGPRRRSPSSENGNETDDSWSRGGTFYNQAKLEFKKLLKEKTVDYPNSAVVTVNLLDQRLSQSKLYRIFYDILKFPGTVKIGSDMLWSSSKLSFITRSLAACILLVLEGRSVLSKGFSKKISTLLQSSGINQSIDVTPQSKELLQQMEATLNIHMIVHNSNRSVIYDSGRCDNTTVSLMWFKRSWYFIDRIELFLSIFECPACPMVTDKHSNLVRHFSSCSFYQHYVKTGELSKDVQTREERVHTGVWYGLKPNKMIDQLNATTNLNITVKDIFSSLIAVIDCESALLTSSESGLLVETRCTNYVTTHQMYCFGAASNVPGYLKTKIFIRASEQDKQFLVDFLQYLLEIADIAYIHNKTKVQHIINRVDYLIDWYSLVGYDFLVTKLEKTKRDLLTYLRRLLVCGYNIFRYDMTLARREGFLELLKEMDGPVMVMKRSKGTYLSIVSHRLKFIDQINYTGKVSLRELLKDHGTGDKSFFPYSKIKKLSDLNQPLPSYDDFYDMLIGCNALEVDEIRFHNKLKEGLTEAQALKALNMSKHPLTGRELYANLLRIWKENDCHNLLDIMKYYLKLDLEPLLKLIVSYRELYLEETKVDLYREYLSMSQFSFNYALSYVDSTKYFFVHLPLDLRQKLQDSLIGGLSIVFHRLAERGMKIRPAETDLGEIITKVLGVDANNLYGYSLAQDQCYGFFVYRSSLDKFKPQYMGEKCSESIQWLQYCAEVRYKCRIRTKWSQEGEHCIHVPIDGDNDAKQRFKSFKVDGYFVDANGLKFVLEYLGERYHGYCIDCRTDENDQEELVGNKTSKQLRESTFERLAMINKVVDRIVIMYDCQWKSMKQRDPEVRCFMSTFQFGPNIKKKQLTQSEALDQILNKDIRGFAQIDAVVPLELRTPSGLADFPPIIKNAYISRETLKGYGKEYATKYDLLEKPTRMLVPSYFCNKTYLSTEYIMFLDSLGVKITHIHEILQFQMADMFLPFILDKSEARVKADLNGQTHVAKLQKDAVNHCYGSSLLNASGLINTKLVDEAQVLKMVGSHLFLDAEACGFDDKSSLWEMVTKKTIIKHKNLITLGFNVLQTSKVHILDYFYNHLKKFIPSTCFQLINTDTDSFYMVHSRESLRACVPPRMLDDYDRSVKKWHVDPSNPWSKRTPGKFHEEFTGTHICAPANKMYDAMDADTGAEKKAHRGVQLRHIDNFKVMHYESYKDVLFERKSNPVIKMTGFADKFGEIMTYESRRSNMNAMMPKREILKDQVSTKPLDHI